MNWKTLDWSKIIIGCFVALLATITGKNEYTAYKESQVVRPTINAVDIGEIIKSPFFILYMKDEISKAIEAKETATAEENTTSLRHLASVHSGVSPAEVPIYLGKLIKFYRALTAIRINGGILTWIKDRSTWEMAGPVRNVITGEIRYNLYGQSKERIEMRKHMDATLMKYMYRREQGTFVPCY